MPLHLHDDRPLTQFVWFAGNSSVGKATAIERCIRDPEWARETFELDVSRGIGQIAGDREGIDSALCHGLPGCVLIHWQNATDGEIVRLRELRPEDLHIVILLRREPEEHFRDYRRERIARHPDLADEPPEVTRAAFEAHGSANEAKARRHREGVDRFMEYMVAGGRYERLDAASA